MLTLADAIAFRFVLTRDGKVKEGGLMSNAALERFIAWLQSSGITRQEALNLMRGRHSFLTDDDVTQVFLLLYNIAGQEITPDLVQQVGEGLDVLAVVPR